MSVRREFSQNPFFSQIRHKLRKTEKNDFTWMQARPNKTELWSTNADYDKKTLENQNSEVNGFEF